MRREGWRRGRGLDGQNQRSCPPGFLDSSVRWPTSTEPSRTLGLSLSLCGGSLAVGAPCFLLSKTSVEAQVVGELWPWVPVLGQLAPECLVLI